MFKNISDELQIFLENYSISTEVTDVVEELLLSMAQIEDMPEYSHFFPVNDDMICFGFNFGIWEMPIKHREKLLEYLRKEIDPDAFYRFLPEENLHGFHIKSLAALQNFIPLFKDEIQRNQTPKSLSSYQEKSLSCSYFKTKACLNNVLAFCKSLRNSLKPGSIELTKINVAENCIFKALIAAKNNQERVPVGELSRLILILSILKDVKPESYSYMDCDETMETHINKLIDLLPRVHHYYVAFRNPQYDIAINLAKAHAKMAITAKEGLFSALPQPIQAHIASFMYSKNVSQFTNNGDLHYPDSLAKEDIEARENFEQVLYRELNTPKPATQTKSSFNLFRLFRLSQTHLDSSSNKPSWTKEKFDNFLELKKVEKFGVPHFNLEKSLKR